MFITFFAESLRSFHKVSVSLKEFLAADGSYRRLFPPESMMAILMKMFNVSKYIDIDLKS